MFFDKFILDGSYLVGLQTMLILNRLDNMVLFQIIHPKYILEFQMWICNEFGPIVFISMPVPPT